MEQEFAELKKQVQALQKELSRVSDEAEVRKIHFKYGYYLDKCLYNEVVDMFSNHPDAYVEFLGGRYRGKAGIARLYQGRFQQAFVKGRNGPVEGWLLDHLMMQEIVDVDSTGTHAWCRMRALMQAGTHESIEEYRYFPFWHAEHEKGWSHTKKNYIPFPTTTYPENPDGPDELVEQRSLWPDTRVIPFHYPHPVTGKRIKDDDLRAPKYGEPVETSEPALVLDLPKGQKREGAEVREAKVGEKVLPDLVQFKAVA
ncbi:SnoaL-like domain-containing protein [Apiosordaria backusii]|uniref:SnoaL-like domain-containing protein n=1 Tax=Apiosordaria backusii TaxID=314023 RepID=A0AA40BM82_9PEZI|nr:SnoaL-like domain-containing protein [Apiosordaria backusii]